MIAENQEGSTAPQPLVDKRQVPWLRLFLSFVLSGLGLWFVLRDTSPSAIRDAFVQAHVGYIFLGFLTILATIVAKTWRWHLLFHPRPQAPSFAHLFWSLSLGQLVNTAIPFLRLGELARVYDLGQQSNSSKARALGTLVVEKILDLVMLAFLLLVLLPYLVLPAIVVDSGLVLALAAIIAFFLLYLMAYHNLLVVRLARKVIRWLPDPLERRLLPIVTAGLQGLAALRSPRAIVALFLSSIFITFLSLLTPFVLFPAFNIALDLPAASAIHVALTVGMLPPSTPAKVGVFEAIVAFMLASFGVENRALIFAYAIVFHMVAIFPQFILGGIAAARGTKDGRR